MKTVAHKTVDEYMQNLPADVLPMLEKVRAAIRSAAPDAEEVISYQMPAYKHNGMLVYFAAFKDHCSFFPVSKKVLEVFKEELKPFKTFGGTIQFTITKPLPATIIKKIVKYRLKANEEKKSVRQLKR